MLYLPNLCGECFQEENITVPQDAYLKDNGTSYEIIPEVEGNQLDQEKVKAAIIEALDYVWFELRNFNERYGRALYMHRESIHVTIESIIFNP